MGISFGSAEANAIAAKDRALAALHADLLDLSEHDGEYYSLPYFVIDDEIVRYHNDYEERRALWRELLRLGWWETCGETDSVTYMPREVGE